MVLLVTERKMASAGKSLRMMVEHWLAPDPATRVRVAEFRNRRSERQCYVRVEVLRARCLSAMLFFRHQDGSWCVFPPREYPEMRVD